ncbi:MAG TPA: CAP domain-containing protein [Rhizomicrobium sp.]
MRLILPRRLFPVLTALLLAGCAAETLPPLAPLPPDPKSQMGALETRIAVLVEEERHRMDPKAKPLAFDAELSKVARARASDMAEKNYLAHQGPDGATSASLLMQDDAKWQGLLGENLAAQHYTRQSGVSVDEFAHRFLDEWLKSPPHRDNMGFINYDHAGVGAAVNGDTVYVAVLFSTDLGLPPPRSGGPASTVTSLESPAAASAAPANPQPAPLRLRGTVGTQ